MTNRRIRAADERIRAASPFFPPFHSAITTAEQLQLGIDNALRTASTAARIANHTSVETARAGLAFNTTQATGNAYASRSYSRTVADATRFHSDLTAETSYFTSVAASRNLDRLDQAEAHKNWSLAVSTAYANAHVTPNNNTTGVVLSEDAIRSNAIQTSNLNRVNTVGPDQTARSFTLGTNEWTQTNSHGSAEVSLASALDGIEDTHDLTEQFLASVERSLDLTQWAAELSNEAGGRQTLTATIGQKRVDLVNNLGPNFLSASSTIASAEAAYHLGLATTHAADLAAVAAASQAANLPTAAADQFAADAAAAQVTWLNQMAPAFTTFVGVTTAADHAALVSAAESARDFDNAEAAAQKNYVNGWTPLVTTLVNAQAASSDTLQNSLRDASQTHRGSGATEGQLRGNAIATANGALRLDRAGHQHQFEQRDVASGIQRPARVFDNTYSSAEADSGMGRGTVVADTDKVWRKWRAAADAIQAYGSALATKLSLKADALATESFAIAEVGLLPAYDAAVTTAQQNDGSHQLNADIARATTLAAAQVAWIGAGYAADVTALTSLDATWNLDFTQHKVDFASAEQVWWNGFAGNYTLFVSGVTSEWQTEQATANSETALLATARTTADVARATTLAQKTHLANDHLADQNELHEQAVADADFHYQITAAEVVRSRDEVALLQARYVNGPEVAAYLANPHPTLLDARSTFNAEVLTPSVSYDVLSESANFWMTSETNTAETAHSTAIGSAFQSYLTNVSEGTRLRRANVATQASAFEQSWSNSFSGMATTFAASHVTPWATFEVAKANAESTRTSTLAPARATQDAGMAQADHDFLSALAGDMATFLSASTEQDNVQTMAQATADLSAVLARGEGLLATTDEFGNPVPIDWTTLISLPDGATGLPANFTPVDPNAGTGDDSMAGGSGDAPLTPFMLPFELPLPPGERLAPETTDADRRDLPDDYRETSNGISTQRGQLAPTHGSTANWSDLYAFAFNDPQNSDNPPVQPKKTVTNVKRQEKENGTLTDAEEPEAPVEDDAPYGHGVLTIVRSTGTGNEYVGQLQMTNAKGDGHDVIIGFLDAQDNVHQSGSDFKVKLTTILQFFPNGRTTSGGNVTGGTGENVPQTNDEWNAFFYAHRRDTVVTPATPESETARIKQVMSGIKADLIIAGYSISEKYAIDQATAIGVGVTLKTFGAGFRLTLNGIRHYRSQKQIRALAKQIGVPLEDGAKLTKQKMDEIARRLADLKLPVLPHVDDASLCFKRDTLVATQHGRRPIGEIAAGELVQAYDFVNGRWTLAKVLERRDNTYCGQVVTVYCGDTKIEATAYHPFWVVEGRDLAGRSVPRELKPDEDQGHSLSGRWVNSHELHEGDVVFSQDGRSHRVDRVEFRFEEAIPVSNLTVAGYHTFTVGNDSILVHNTAWCDYLRNKIGDAPSSLTKVLKKLQDGGATKARIHAHHIVMKGNWAEKSPEVWKYLEPTQKLLDKHKIDVAYSLDNMTWAINWDHSSDYAKAIWKELDLADRRGGRDEIISVLKRIAELLQQGKKFRGLP